MLKLIIQLKVLLLRFISEYYPVDIRYSQHFRVRKGWGKKYSNKPIAVLWAFTVWKRHFIPQYLPEYRVLFALNDGNWEIQKKQMDSVDNLTFVVWGHKAPVHVLEYAEKRDIPLYRMEDGFIRSVELGVAHSVPLSLVLDRHGIYFDATKPSDLENLLNTYDFTQIQNFSLIAQQLIQTMRTWRISKYNTGVKTDIKALLGQKKRYRILVVGQLETDASLKYGLASHMTNNALLLKAHDDYPEAEIIYRPHPDTLYLNVIDSMSGQEEQFYRIFSDPVLLADLFAEVDHVYTMTSLSGFEALIHGLKVTVAGMPFYAGWGLTEDMQQIERRTRKLTLEELFYGAYILYPRYLLDIQNPAAGCLKTMCEIAVKVSGGIGNVQE